MTRPGISRSVLLIGSEALPFSKTGGLADVLGALPPALSRLGWDVTLAVPRYRDVAPGEPVASFPVTVGGFTHSVTCQRVELEDEAHALLIDCPELFDRDALYGVDAAGYEDNARRFAVLVRASLDYTAHRGVAPSVVHAHDWQAGLAPVYLRTRYAGHRVLGGTPSVFTIHNLAYQGLFDADWVPRLDLGWETFTPERLEFWGQLSLLKGGINDAAFVTTVSQRYAEEIQTPEFGFGFDGILRHRRAHLVGILNGIDTAQWNPARDPYLPAPFTADDFSGKATAKAAVLAQYGLRVDDASMRRPLLGMISRMVDQKGLDLLEALADELPRLDATFIILGTGEPRYQDMWKRMASAHPAKVAVRVGFDEALAHLIEGGADIFLMPSKFEPCGLNQMYSLRYGTVPLVRAVGGLADTVVDYRPDRPKATGFAFDAYTPEALMDTLRRALAVYGDRARWKRLQRAGMAQDHSWDRSAREYVRIYERAMEAAGRPGGAPLLAERPRIQG